MLQSVILDRACNFSSPGYVDPCFSSSDPCHLSPHLFRIPMASGVRPDPWYSAKVREHLSDWSRFPIGRVLTSRKTLLLSLDFALLLTQSLKRKNQLWSL